MRIGYPWLLALAAVGCFTARSAAPKGNIDWQQPPDVKPTLLVSFVGLALFGDERVEANALVAAWAISHGWRVVDPTHAHKVLSRARAGLDPRTGTTCGLPLPEWVGAVRWKEALGAQGLLDAFVACERGACKLRVMALDSADEDRKVLANLAAPFDTALPWRDALTRALGTLVRNQGHRIVGGLGLKGRSRSPGASARPSQLTFSTSSASALDSRELFQDAVSLSSAGMSSLRACFDDSGSAELLVAIDDLGRVARCESRNADDAAAACACDAFRAGGSAAESIRGKRAFLLVRHRPDDVVTPWGALVEAVVVTHLEGFTNRLGKLHFRPAVSDRSIAHWSPPAGSTLARCFTSAASESEFAISVHIGFDARGLVTSVATSSRTPLSTSQDDCVRAAFQRSRAPCPDTLSPTATAVVRVKVRTTADATSTVEGSPEMNPTEDPEKEQIRRVIRANIGQIRSCYESELKTKPTLAGKVRVRFIIDPAGDVAQALDAEGSTLDEPQLSECIRAQVRNWKFPIPKGAGCVVVTYPFMFRPSGK